VEDGRRHQQGPHPAGDLPVAGFGRTGLMVIIFNLFQRGTLHPERPIPPPPGPVAYMAFA
jgi:hypothetical protein